MNPALVILAVGLSPALVGEHTPNLKRLAARGGTRPLATIMPAVTCSVQSTLLTGLPPSGHGIVANGWYFRNLSEIWLWRQSNRLVAGEKVWDAAKLTETRTKIAELRALEAELEDSLDFLATCHTACESELPVHSCPTCERHPERPNAPDLVAGVHVPRRVRD